MSASRTVLGRLFQSLGAKQKTNLPPAVDFDILGIIKWPEFWEHSGHEGLKCDKSSLKYWVRGHLKVHWRRGHWRNGLWRSRHWSRFANLCSNPFNPSKCTHTVVNTHGTANAAAPSEQLGVWCLAQGSHHSCGIGEVEQRWLFTHPTDNSYQTWDSNPWPSGFKSDSLSIRPRLPKLCMSNNRLAYKLSKYVLVNGHC